MCPTVPAYGGTRQLMWFSARSVPTRPIASAVAINTCATRSIRPSSGQWRRPQNAGSESAPKANIAPRTRSALGRCRYKAAARQSEVTGADRAVPHSMTTAGFRTSSELPIPKGSPDKRCFIATTPPAASTAVRAMTSRFAVISTRAVCPPSKAHTMVRPSRLRDTTPTSMATLVADSVLWDLATESFQSKCVRFGAAPAVGVQAVDCIHLVGGQLEVEDVDVLRDPVGLGGLRNDRTAVL